jgi:sterol 3beta-glucosyltransferase
MRLTVVTFGSDGDTRPFAVLARGLMQAGHEVHLFGERASLPIVGALGVPHSALAGDVVATLPPGGPDVPMSRGDALQSVQRLNQLIRNNTPAWMRTIAEHARTADAVLFSGLSMFAGLGAALELNKPHIGLWLQPISPTRELSSPMMPPMKLPGWLNRLSYRALHTTLWHYYGKAANAARREVFGGAARSRMYLDCPILYGISPQLLARPSDWPAQHQLCGYWSAAPEDWQAPAQLQDFLAAGPAPIYVGLGSASVFLRRKRLDAIIAAVAGRRALFYPAWSQIDATCLPENFHVIGPTPHSWLLPRCSLAIHHGGAGTTHAAARAGIPSMVLPLGGDQFFWSSRLSAAGVAPKFLAPPQVTGAALSTAMEFTQTDVVRERAQALGAAMAREDGVGEGVRRITALLGAHGSSGSASQAA